MTQFCKAWRHVSIMQIIGSAYEDTDAAIKEIEARGGPMGTERQKDWQTERERKTKKENRKKERKKERNKAKRKREITIKEKTETKET